MTAQYDWIKRRSVSAEEIESDRQIALLLERSDMYVGGCLGYGHAELRRLQEVGGPVIKAVNNIIFKMQ